MRPYIIICLLFTSLSFSSFLGAQSAADIVQGSIDLINGKSSEALTSMTVVRPKYSRTIEMKTWSYGNDYFLIYITDPAQEKGQVFLKRETDMWNWLPKISRMIKLPPSMMSQNWMGSDFTNDDLVKVNSLVSEYEHTLLGEEEIEGLTCYKIEMIPKPESAVVWGKVNIWVAKDEAFQMRMEYFDEDMEMVNIMEAFDIQTFDDRRLPSRLVMTPVQKKGQQTILITKSQSFNVDIGQDFFSQQNMKRVR